MMTSNMRGHLASTGKLEDYEMTFDLECHNTRSKSLKHHHCYSGQVSQQTVAVLIYETKKPSAMFGCYIAPGEKIQNMQQLNSTN